MEDFSYTCGGLLFSDMPYVLPIVSALLYDTIYSTMYFVGIICIIIVLKFFMKIMPKRTPYGNEMLGKIKGFKRFLEIAEKEQLEALVNENPKYFYNILPYTYALGVSDVWMSQFETIALQAPDWYDCSGPFMVYDFNVFMDNTLKEVKTAMISIPFKGPETHIGGSFLGSFGGFSDGGSSGGGFSGGGSGGGGGGSW